MSKEKSAVSLCRQVAAWGLDMFQNFCLVKNHKIPHASTTTKAREKISAFGIFGLFSFVCLTRIKTIRF
jgi:hypothetical protein